MNDKELGILEGLILLREKVSSLEHSFEKLETKLDTRIDKLANKCIDSLQEVHMLFTKKCSECSAQKMICERKFSKAYILIALLTAIGFGKGAIWVYEIIYKLHGMP